MSALQMQIWLHDHGLKNLPETESALRKSEHANSGSVQISHSAASQIAHMRGDLIVGQPVWNRSGFDASHRHGTNGSGCAEHRFDRLVELFKFAGCQWRLGLVADRATQYFE